MPCLLIKRKRKIILLTKQVQQGLNLLAIKKLKDKGACCFEMYGASDIRIHLDQNAQERLLVFSATRVHCYANKSLSIPWLRIIIKYA